MTQQSKTITAAINRTTAWELAWSRYTHYRQIVAQNPYHMEMVRRLVEAKAVVDAWGK